MTVLITGATDGIGRALAEICRGRGERLALVGRRALDSFECGLYSDETYCEADLSEADCAEKVCSFLRSRRIDALDLAIQNAATGYYGSVANQTEAGIRTILAVNLLAPLRLTHALAPFVNNARGKHVLIGSIAHAFPCPEFAVYAATKEALDVFGRNLRVEGDVNVQVIHSGATQMGIDLKSGWQDEDSRAFPPCFLLWCGDRHRNGREFFFLLAVVENGKRYGGRAGLLANESEGPVFGRHFVSVFVKEANAPLAGDFAVGDFQSFRTTVARVDRNRRHWRRSFRTRPFRPTGPRTGPVHLPDKPPP